MSIDGGALHSVISEYERLAEEKRAAAERQKEQLALAQEDHRLDPKTIRLLLAERRRESRIKPGQREDLDAYREVLSRWETTPLGAAGNPRTAFSGKAPIGEVLQSIGRQVAGLPD